MKLEALSDYYISRALFTAVVLIVTLFVSIFLKKAVDLFVSGVKKKLSSDAALARTRTLRNLFKNVVDIVLLLTASLVILSYWGVNIIPILTGASILGLAVSFGAQTLVKDVIAGVFIILEDQFHIGDKIKVDKFEGEVINISLRLTVLRDKTGNYIYIPNSQITTLIRFTPPPKIVTETTV
jgi:small conductance mechanosensitive channel